MVSRSVIFLVCISLVGVTVLPASLLPCCCKFERVRMLAGGTASQCPLHKEKRPDFVRQTVERSCCSAKPVFEKASPTTCCSQKTMYRVDCGNCRCLEQMQIVTLSGYSVGQLTARFHDAPMATDAPSLPCVVSRQVSSLPEVYAPSHVVLLKTCILLI